MKDKLKCSLTSLYREAKEKFGVSSLLTKPFANPKVFKNQKLGYVTSPLHLAPAKLSGYEVCPMRSKGCTAACLHTAGNPAYMKGKEKARVARTKMFFENRELFMTILYKEIENMFKKHGKSLCIRLNATSDIPWENTKYRGKNLMEHFPQVTFYDYTKRHNRKNLPKNYTLTYSLAEDNMDRAIKAFENGMNVAVVFRDELPNSFLLGSHLVTVLDGDVSDCRFLDKKNSIVGLKAKGKAKNDTSGFVQESFPFKYTNSITNSPSKVNINII